MTDVLTPGVTDPAASAEPGAFAGTAARRQWRTIADRFLRHRAAMAGLVLFALLLAFAFLGPVLWTAGLDAGGEAKVPPSAAHPFGTAHNAGTPPVSVSM